MNFYVPFNMQFTNGFQSVSRSSVLALSLLVLSACATAPTLEEPKEVVEKVPAPVIAETIGLAEKAIEEVRYDDAQLMLERVLLVDPENPRAILNLAEVRLARGEVVQAKEAFASLVENEEVGAQALQGEGICLVLLGKANLAAKKLEAAVEIDRTLWRAFNVLATYHDSQGEWAEASEYYDLALSMRPGDALLYNNRGFSLMLRGSYDESMKDFATALRIDPELEIARRNIRLALAWKGEYVRALSGTPIAEKGEILNNIGYIAILRGDYEIAESYLLQAMEADAAFNKAAWRNLDYLKDMRAIAAVESSASEEILD